MVYSSIYYCIRVNPHIIVSIVLKIIDHLLNFKVESK